ncbi:MAG: purine-nucleoside phosphorylase [Actinomycetia bacterium]|nr:purine-nucleoside phosphorylase [Actinomycetes bacterium]
MALKDRINETLDFLARRLESHLETGSPEVLIILGSGLNDCAAAVDDAVSIGYQDIPHFQTSTAPGHTGRLIFGSIAGCPVLCMQGRLHYYEGNTPEQIVLPLQAARAMGAHTLVVTNAAGGINPAFAVGDLMLISDHINFTAASPLTFGEDQGLDDFIDMSHAYSPELRRSAKDVAAGLGVILQEGVYLGVRGPSFETPAEIRAFRTLGADAVGMSTIFEVLAAVQLGMQVLGISMISNPAAGLGDRPLSGDDVLAASRLADQRLQGLLQGVIAKLPRGRQQHWPTFS